MKFKDFFKISIYLGLSLLSIYGLVNAIQESRKKPEEIWIEMPAGEQIKAGQPVRFKFERKNPCSDEIKLIEVEMVKP